MKPSPERAARRGSVHATVATSSSPDRATRASGVAATVASSPNRASTRPRAAPSELIPGEQVGRLTIERLLGAGGMGVVYAAHDPELNREVALKLIRGGLDTEAASARLYREAQALAKLAHPNIVAVYDVGTHEDQVWLSMEFVIGRTLDAWAEEERPSWRQALAIMKQAMRGVMAAHAEGLLHRDIKPDNIMLGDDGRVRVMDFGLARAGEDEGEGKTTQDESVDTRVNDALSIELTAAGAIMGTPAYMAPEQFLGFVADERTDQFSLGVTLWETLYGQPPFAGKTFSELRESVTAGTRAPVPANSGVPAWLRKVLERALQVHRGDRFESVRVMLDAIENGEQRARARAIVAGLTGLVAVLIALGIVALFQWRAATISEERAKQNEVRAVASEEQAKQNEARAVASEAETKRALSVQRGLRATMLIPENSEAEALRLAVQAVGAWGPEWTQPPPAEATEGLERVLTEDATIIDRAHVLRGHTANVISLSYSPDGARIATASMDRTAKIWDTATGALLTTLEGHKHIVTAVAFSPDGARVTTASFDQTARIWDATSGALVTTLAGHTKPVYTVAYAPDGARLATAGMDQTARVWDAATGDPVATLTGHTKDVEVLAFAPDGARLATGSMDHTAKLWDPSSGRLIADLAEHEDPVYDVAFAPDGARLATASFDNTVKVWDANTGARVLTLKGHDRNVTTLAYSPDGAHIASAGEDHTARIWSAATGEPIATLRGHEHAIFDVAFSRDGARVATASKDHTARVWDATSGRMLATLHGHTNFVYTLAHAPSGPQLATAAMDSTARLWDTSLPDEVTTLRGHEGMVGTLVYSPDGGAWRPPAPIRRSSCGTRTRASSRRPCAATRA